jgi:diguanylate cyclase
MELYGVARDDLQEMIAQLQQALFHHQQWHAALIRALICKLPADQHDFIPDAHHECRFGQWYYGKVPEKLRNLPGFIALGNEHQRMHQLATKLLIEAKAGGTVIAFDFDNFTNALDRMRLEISALECELENVLYNHDPLTGAINRFGILPALREQQELIKREVLSCCIAMVDLDNFKDINDLHGHLVGDYVLTAAARYLIKHLRPYDKIFRYGGEEFLILMQHTEVTSCYDMMERLRKGLATMSIEIDKKELPIHITASFGVVLLVHDAPVETSIDRADKAMYAAKAAGRNCVRIWSAGDVSSYS